MQSEMNTSVDDEGVGFVPQQILLKVFQFELLLESINFLSTSMNVTD